MKPIIKEKKPVKKKRFNWATFMKYFRTIWKNDACVESSIVPRKKNNHVGAKYWWVSIPLFLASLVLAMTPLTVHASERTGSSMLGERTFNIDELLYTSLVNNENESYVPLSADIKKLEFSNHLATLEFNEKQTQVYEDKVYYIGFHKGLIDIEENGISSKIMDKDFDVFFINEDGLDEAKYKTLLEAMCKTTYALDKSEATDDKKVNLITNETITRKYTSFLAFSKTKFFLYLAAGQPTNPQISGDFLHLENGYFINLITKGSNNPTRETCMNNFKTFTDNVYETNRTNITAAQSGISLAVNGGIVILLGFILYFLTRGKQNPYRYITCYETLNMAMWATTLPAIIALIFGFIFPGMEMMLFLVAFGFRVMWMAMRNLRPQAY